MTVDTDFIEGLLRDAVVSLSLPAAEQCRVTAPGCVACELLNDFDHAYKCFSQSCVDRLTPKRSQLLGEIDRTMDSMSDPDFVCFDPSVLDRPVWATLRDLAAQAVALFGWQDHVVSPYTEIAPGIWRRPASTSTIARDNNGGASGAQE